MARRCGCASDSCSCTITAGPGIQVTGTGTDNNNFVISSTVATIETGIDIQKDNVGVINNVHALDFRGSAVTITPGIDEAVISITASTGGTGTPVPPGVMTMFAGAVAPAGWLLCQGQTVLVADYPDLFAAISNFYGGDGTANFMVPNMQDLLPMGAGTTYPRGGAPAGVVNNQVALAVPNLPPHSHTITHSHTLPAHSHNDIISSGGSVPNWNVNAFAAGTVSGMAANGQALRTGSANAGPTASISTTASGNGTGTATPINITPRHLPVNYIIKT